MTRARVLIVDDDPALLEALSDALQLRLDDVAVETCNAAPAALGRISATDYDALVVDIKMPGMDGLELLARIRQVRPDTPTLLITGHGEHDLAVQALRGGAHDYIQKPIDRDYFVGSLNHALEVRRLGRLVATQKQSLERHAKELQECLEERTHELRELYQRESLARAEADRAKRELEEAQRRREELVSMVAHDIGTPLTTLSGYAELLGRPDMAPARRERARSVILSETHRLARLVRDLLDASRLAAGRLRVRRVRCDLAAIAREQVELAGARSERHSIRLEGPEALAAVCDRDRLAQVLSNLLANAIAHTAGGQVVVRLWTEDHEARLSVRDEGPGIPADGLEAIFEPHARLAPDRPGDGPTGRGLGLSIAKGIVEAHGGRIWAESPPGRGATFHVSLPLPRASTGAAERKAAAGASRGRRGRATRSRPGRGPAAKTAPARPAR
jgi:two-component system, sensor histidine kinase and response regulator